jgi:hypothetical protein
MEDILKFFMQQRPEGWETTAQSWLMAIMVIAILGAGLMFGYKALQKSRARIAGDKPWSRGQTIILILMGLVPLSIFLTLLWYLTPDYYEYVGGSGWMSGLFVSGLVYLILMIVGHLLSPWRRELL